MKGKNRWGRKGRKKTLKENERKEETGMKRKERAMKRKRKQRREKKEKAKPKLVRNKM